MIPHNHNDCLVHLVIKSTTHLFPNGLLSLFSVGSAMNCAAVAQTNGNGPAAGAVACFVLVLMVIGVCLSPKRPRKETRSALIQNLLKKRERLSARGAARRRRHRRVSQSWFVTNRPAVKLYTGPPTHIMVNKGTKPRRNTAGRAKRHVCRNRIVRSTHRGTPIVFVGDPRRYSRGGRTVWYRYRYDAEWWD
jgi:hypothetical protein